MDNYENYKMLKYYTHGYDFYKNLYMYSYIV